MIKQELKTWTQTVNCWTCNNIKICKVHDKYEDAYNQFSDIGILEQNPKVDIARAINEIIGQNCPYYIENRHKRKV